MNQQRRKESRCRDPELIKMVENYLIRNSNKTYVDIEDMVASLQSKSYRFSRMKKQVFVTLVKDAYDAYCHQNNAFGPEDSYAKPVPAANNQVDDINIIASDISDSDIEIEEQPKTSISVQINSLYKSKAGPSTPVVSQKPIPPRKKGILNFPPNEGSSSSTASAVSLGEAVSPPRVGEFLENEKSEDDLEIIDEVNGGRSPSILKMEHHFSNDVSKSPVVPKISTLKPIIKSVSPRRERHLNGIATASGSSADELIDSKTSLTYLNDSGSDTPRTPSQKRGLKRKTVVFQDETPPDVSHELKKNKKDHFAVLDSCTTFADFGGSEKVIEEICKLLMHLKHPEIYQTLGVTPPRGFMLHGPPGCGKTLLANAIAGELKLPMLKMAATELISGISGESENNIRQLFDQALSLAPCVIFIDEIDSITPKRETAQREMEKRIVAQLLACIDDLANKEKGNLVLLIGATNRVESIDIALRRAGRFDREICLGIPDERAREKILRVLSQKLRLSPDFNISKLAKLTPGYVGADLQALLREAAVESVNGILTLAGVTTTKLGSNTIVNGTPSKSKEIEVDIERMAAEDEDDKGMEVNTEKGTVGAENDSAMDVDKENKTEGDDVHPPTDEKSETAEKSISTDAPTSTNEIPVKLSEQCTSRDSSNIDPIRWLREMAPFQKSELDGLFIQMKDFEEALKRVQPSSKREGFATVPDTTWDDIGALKEIRDELEVSILGPVKYFSAFQALGLNTPAGVLLCGPPGCGKTLLAKAVANEAGINFISVKGPELLNMYVGESERAVRQCFLRAKNSSPCVIFFDELDALCPRRSEGPESGSTSRVVNQLLTEMDGMESRTGVFIMAATNRPDIIDPAVLRPGRLDKVLFVNLPSPLDRVDILKTITKSGSKPLLGEDVNLETIGMSDKCASYTGADLAALVREASIAAFRELVLEAGLKNEAVCKDEDLKAYQRHFDAAFRKTKPSVSKKDQEKYEQMKEKYSSLS